jgi:hypothetical protein
MEGECGNWRGVTARESKDILFASEGISSEIFAGLVEMFGKVKLGFPSQIQE